VPKTASINARAVQYSRDPAHLVNIKFRKRLLVMTKVAMGGRFDRRRLGNHPIFN
jgi:hypothetical protein